MAKFPAARVTDMHVCPMSPVPPGLPIIPPTSFNVFIGGLPAARMTDRCACVGPPPAPVDAILKGSSTVLINGLPAARMLDPTVKGGVISTGWPTVLIGEVGVAPPAGPGIISGLAKLVAKVLAAVKKVLDTKGKPKGAPGAALEAAAAAVNPEGSVVNCGHIIDAVIARLRGTDPDAVAPAERDGSFDAIEERLGTTIGWNSDFQAAYDAVRNGGPGTVAVVGIEYSGGGSHVVILANDNGTVGIVEGQNWGEGNPAEVITDVDRANERYNADGGSNVGWGLVP